jgi:CHAT domain-containing protein
LTVVHLPKEAEIAEWAAALLDLGRLASGDSTDLEAEGYRMLLAPVAGRIKGKGLVIVPTGALCQVPFEMLVARARGEAGNDRFLIENHTVRYVPSLTVARLTQEWEAKRPRPDRVLWAAGDPVYEPTDPRLKEKTVLAPASRAKLAQQVRGDGNPYKRLPYSGEEILAVRAACRAAADDPALTGAAATEAAVKAASASGALARYRYVHFATHGTLGMDSRRQPSLVLSLIGNNGKADALGANDGFLQMDEVMQLKMNADLVVLSACDTGRGRLYAGEGVRGLARAFQYAGCRDVVCSLWRVSDRETARLMASLYDEMAGKGRPAGEALRAAKLGLIKAGKPPLYWAPFVLFGE